MITPKTKIPRANRTSASRSRSKATVKTSNPTNGQFRVESDSLGEVKVPADRIWGAQTQRSLEHFSIGKDLIPREMITAYATLKKGFAAAKASVAADAVLNGATDGGAIAVLQAYHAALVPPFCLSAVKSFFDGF